MKNMSAPLTYCALAVCTLFGTANAQAADFTTNEGFTATCQEVQQANIPASIQTDDSRVASVICRDTALVQQIITWGTHEFQQFNGQNGAPPVYKKIITEIETEIDYARTQISLSQSTLEKIRLGNKKSLRLVPAEWSMDLDGDGKIDLWEKYFFAIPKRGKHVFNVAMPNNTQAYYDNQYQLDAAIKVDQSDVLWALSYHYFIGGLLANVRAFDFSEKFEVKIARPELLKTAHQLIDQGLSTSEKMRQSVLAETSNDEEWIANPKQTSSVFPMELDKDDFVTWGVILKESTALWEGKRLLGVARGSGGVLGELNLCKAGTGLNIKQLYLQPPPTGTTLPLQKDTQFSSTYCQRIDAHHTLSTLPDMMAHANAADPGMHFLRYLYWTN